MKFLSFLLPLFLLTPTLAAQGDAKNRSVTIDINFDGSPEDFKRIASEMKERVRAGEIPRELAQGILGDIREKMDGRRKNTGENKEAKRGEKKAANSAKKKAANRGQNKEAKRGKSEHNRERMDPRGQRMRPGDLIIRGEARGRVKGGRPEHDRERMDPRGQRMRPGNDDRRRQEDGRRGPGRDSRHDDRPGPWNDRNRHEGVSLWG